jgi:amidohydrolase
MTALDWVMPAIDEITDWQETLYRDVHRHPELSMQEVRTRGIVADHLRQQGFAVDEFGGGVVGVLANGEGPTVLFRADMDALPVLEAERFDYRSTDTGTLGGETVPVMHACGHDMHVASAIGAAAVLAAHRDHWRGTYIALFQPGEEVAAGARSMVAAGLVDRVPRPDVALGQHVLATPVSGSVAIAAGPVLSTAVSIRVTVYGHGSHGSMPHLSVDPVVLAAAIVTRLQTVVAREVAPDQFGVVTVGSLRAGASANIIPDDATMLLNLRAYDHGLLTQMQAAVERIVRAECGAARSPRDPQIEAYDPYPLTDNDPPTAARIRAGMVAVLGEDRVLQMQPATASEDFSTLPDAFGVPYAYWGFGGFVEGRPTVANHNPGFLPDLQPTLRTGTAAAVAGALAWLGLDD